MVRMKIGFFVLGVCSALLLVAMFHVISNVRVVEFSGSIYIRANGSVEPRFMPILTVDNVIYFFIGNTHNPIVIERSNIIVDGKGYTVHGNGSGNGLTLHGVNNVTIKNINIKGFICGISVSHSYNNTISGNNITKNAGDNGYGIWLDSSYNNITHNNITDNHPMGIWLTGNAHHNNISGNKIAANYWGGLFLSGSSNNVISGNLFSNWHDFYISRGFGNIISGNNLRYLDLSLTSNNIVSGNSISNAIGIVDGSFNNSIVGNNVDGRDGIWMHSDCSSNRIYHNNFNNVLAQAYIHNVSISFKNFWDDDGEGNYWRSYTGVDADHDGIGDSWFKIDENNIDHYPLMGMFSDFNATPEYHVQTICNSTISDFQFNGTAISFNVSGEDGADGFCRICIPTELMNGTYKVFVNGTKVQYDILPAPISARSYLYFTYTHSTKEVIITL